jgi:hypothetical protein
MSFYVATILLFGATKETGDTDGHETAVILNIEASGRNAGVPCIGDACAALSPQNAFRTDGWA